MLLADAEIDHALATVTSRASQPARLDYARRHGEGRKEEDQRMWSKPGHPRIRRNPAASGPGLIVRRAGWLVIARCGQG